MKTPSKKNLLALAAISFVTASIAFAATSAVYDTFGVQPGFTAGGTPTVPAAISSDGVITLALKAQQRYMNPALTNNGAGTYFATTGQNDGLGPSPKAQASTWNFDFYINPGNSGSAAYTYSLSYGLVGGTTYSFNPLLDTDAIAQAATTGAYQDSQNLLFPGFGTNPLAANGFTTFNPNANGTYHFELTATNRQTQAVTTSAINVKVNSVPDGGSMVALLGGSLLGLGGFRRFLSKRG